MQKIPKHVYRAPQPTECAAGLDLLAAVKLNLLLVSRRPVLKRTGKQTELHFHSHFVLLTLIVFGANEYFRLNNL